MFYYFLYLSLSLISQCSFYIGVIYNIFIDIYIYIDLHIKIYKIYKCIKYVKWNKERK